MVILEKLPRKKLCVDRSYMPLKHVQKIGLNYHTVKSVCTKPTKSEGLYNVT